jgi:hypothetical protein
MKRAIKILKKNITFQCKVVGLPVEIKGIEVIDIK